MLLHILPLAPTPPVAPAPAPVERPIEYCQVAVTPQQKRRSEIPFSAAGNEHRRMRKTGSGLFCSRNE